MNTYHDPMKQGITNDGRDKETLELFERFLYAHEKEIFYYILKTVRSVHDAQDLTQDTFITFYKHRERLDVGKNPRALLYAIARSRTIDWFRKIQKKEVVFSDLYSEDDGDRLDTTLMLSDEGSEHKHWEQSIDIESALTKIKPIYRDVIRLFYLHGYSCNDIAKHLSMPLNTIKTHLSRGRLALKHHLV